MLSIAARSFGSRLRQRQSCLEQLWTGGGIQLTTFEKMSTDTQSEDLKKQLNKLKYRSHQRGLLELDILLGRWSENALPRMNTESLNAFEAFLEEETPSLYKWVTGQEPFPSRLQDNTAFMEFYGFVQQKVKDHSAEASRNRSRAEWLRGWHDKGNQN